MRRSLTAVVAAMVVAGVSAACLMHEPGTSLGTFGVTGTLTKQTCGSGITADNPWTFNVRLSRSTHTLYWLQDSAPAISGNIDTQGNAVITSSSTFDLQLPNDAGVGYCGVIRSDDFTAALGASATPTSFTGTLTYHYDVAAGSDCTGLLPAAGFGTMPCDVSYKLAGAKK